MSGLRTAPRGEIHIDGAELVGNSSTVVSSQAGGTITAGSVSGDNIKQAGLLAAAPLPALASSRAMLARLAMPRGRIWQAPPAKGEVRMAEDFTGAAYGSSRLSTYYASHTTSWGTAGGFWGKNATCLERTRTDGDIMGFGFNGFDVTGPVGYYGMMLSYRASQANPLLTMSAAGAPFAMTDIPIPGGDEWVTIGMGWFRDTATASGPVFGIKGDRVNPISVKFGLVTICRFDTRCALEAWFRTGLVHMTEG